MVSRGNPVHSQISSGTNYVLKSKARLPSQTGRCQPSVSIEVGGISRPSVSELMMDGSDQNILHQMQELKTGGSFAGAEIQLKRVTGSGRRNGSEPGRGRLSSRRS